MGYPNKKDTVYVYCTTADRSKFRVTDDLFDLNFGGNGPWVARDALVGLLKRSPRPKVCIAVTSEEAYLPGDELQLIGGMHIRADGLDVEVDSLGSLRICEGA